jgi:hypothetical protein
LRFYGGSGGGIDLGKIGSPKGFPSVTISAMAKMGFVP